MIKNFVPLLFIALFACQPLKPIDRPSAPPPSPVEKNDAASAAAASAAKDAKDAAISAAAASAAAAKVAAAINSAKDSNASASAANATVGANIADAQLHVAAASANQDKISGNSNSLPSSPAQAAISADAALTKKELTDTKSSLDAALIKVTITQSNLDQTEDQLDRANDDNSITRDQLVNVQKQLGDTQIQLGNVQLQLGDARAAVAKQDAFIATQKGEIEARDIRLAEMQKQIDWDNKYGTKLFVIGTSAIALSVLLAGLITASFFYPALQLLPVKLVVVASGTSLVFGMLCFQYLEYHEDITKFLKYAGIAAVITFIIYLVLHFWHNAWVAKAEVATKNLENNAISEAKKIALNEVEKTHAVLDAIATVTSRADLDGDGVFNVKDINIAADRIGSIAGHEARTLFLEKFNQ